MWKNQNIDKFYVSITDYIRDIFVESFAWQATSTRSERQHSRTINHQS